MVVTKSYDGRKNCTLLKRQQLAGIRLRRYAAFQID